MSETQRNVLVTGHDGYIGSVLTEILVQRGWRVTGYDTGIFRDVAFVPRGSAAHTRIAKDIRDAEPADFQGIDVVMHLAALSNDPLGSLNPDATHAINHRATVRLAQAAKAAGVKRFLFSSSCSMYGVSTQDFVTEDAAFNPQTAYASAKVAAERDLRPLADDRFSPIYLRNATAFGVSPRMRLDLVVQNLMGFGFLDGVISILSDGTPWRPLVHIRDISEAFIHFAELPRDQVHNQAFNIGHEGNNVQVKDIAAMIHELLPATRVEIKNENPADNRSYRVSFAKAYAAGFKPRVALREGVQETFDAFRKANFSPADFSSDAYVTLKRYQRLMNEGRMDADLRLQPQPTSRA